MEELSSVSLLERDAHTDDALLTWRFPKALVPEAILLHKSGIVAAEASNDNNNNNSSNNNGNNNGTNNTRNDETEPHDAATTTTTTTTTRARFFRYQDVWVYTHLLPTPLGPALPRTRAVVVALTARAYHPEKFGALAAVLAQLYARTGDPTHVMQAYLRVFSQGSMSTKDGLSFAAASHSLQEAYFTGAFRELLELFGMEAILLYTALLLRKRVVVYSGELERLLRFTRCLPLFVSHRMNWEIVRPIVDLDDEQEVEDLNKMGVYVAGFTDPAVESREDLFDLYADLDARTLTVPEHSKSHFLMGKPHKELAEFLVAASQEKEKSEAAVVKALAGRTSQLIASVTALIPAGQETVTAEIIKEQNYPNAVARFMWNIAIAEQKAQL